MGDGAAETHCSRYRVAKYYRGSLAVLVMWVVAPCTHSVLFASSVPLCSISVCPIPPLFQGVSAAPSCFPSCQELCPASPNICPSTKVSPKPQAPYVPHATAPCTPPESTCPSVLLPPLFLFSFCLQALHFIPPVKTPC